MGITDKIHNYYLDDANYFKFLVLDTAHIQKNIIDAKATIELNIHSLEEYALLVNLAQLPTKELSRLLTQVQKLIRTKYEGRLTEFRLDAPEEN